MPVVLGKEKSKYGSGTGSIIIWPVELTSQSPNAEDNIKRLPAGYLKCDGTVYKAEDYPQLAEILGVGSASKFIRRDISNDPIDDVDDDEFIVPDLGSKFPKPTTGGSAGTYINIVKNYQAGTERRRSGMGIEATATAGTTQGNTTVIPVSYTGNFTVPSQEIALKGKPAWTKGTNNTGFTDQEAVDSLALHSHMHFATTNRLRLKTTNETGGPRGQGIGSYYTASTIPIQKWMDNTQYNNSEGAGTNQKPCWAIASGITSRSSQVDNQSGVAEVVYSNYCYNLSGASGLNSLRYQCLLNQATNFDLDDVDFYAPPNFISHAIIPLIGCVETNSGSISDNGTVPATYIQGGQGVPNDWKGASLYDVVPLNVNSNSKSQTSYPQVNNTFTEIDELAYQPGADPTIHNHKILLTQNTHTYKIKTNGFLLSPDNLQTTLTLQTDQVASLDQVTSPYIIMEYLIKY